MMRIFSYDLVMEPGFYGSNFELNSFTKIIKRTKSNIKSFKREKRLDRLLKKSI